MKVGILGGGQLARMLAQAGGPMGVSCMFLSPDPQACAKPFGEHLCVAYDDPDGQHRLAEWADVITYEFENVPEAAVAVLERRRPVYPSSLALAASRDRLVEKDRFRALGLAPAEFRAVDSLADLIDGAAEIGLPAILKTRSRDMTAKARECCVTRQTCRRHGSGSATCPAFWSPWCRSIANFRSSRRARGRATRSTIR